MTDYDQLTDRLERPRTRRQRPLPQHHHKRWGHGNSTLMIAQVWKQNLTPMHKALGIRGDYS